MAAGITTSIRMSAEVNYLYGAIAWATGRTKNDAMVEVLRTERLRRVQEIAMIEIAMILEGSDQARTGCLSSHENVVARFKQRGMLPA